MSALRSGRALLLIGVLAVAARAQGEASLVVASRGLASVLVRGEGASSLPRGERLQVLRDGRTIGEVEVTSPSGPGASCRIVSQTRPIGAGDRVVRAAVARAVAAGVAPAVAPADGAAGPAAAASNTNGADATPAAPPPAARAAVAPAPAPAAPAAGVPTAAAAPAVVRPAESRPSAPAYDGTTAAAPAPKPVAVAAAAPPPTAEGSGTDGDASRRSHTQAGCRGGRSTGGSTTASAEA